MFLFMSKLYVLENIPCYYSQHAGKWDPAYTNASYVTMPCTNADSFAIPSHLRHRPPRALSRTTLRRRCGQHMQAPHLGAVA